jgi:hypothetical protein
VVVASENSEVYLEEDATINARCQAGLIMWRDRPIIVSRALLVAFDANFEHLISWV